MNIDFQKVIFGISYPKAVEVTWPTFFYFSMQLLLSPRLQTSKHNRCRNQKQANSEVWSLNSSKIEKNPLKSIVFELSEARWCGPNKLLEKVPAELRLKNFWRPRPSKKKYLYPISFSLKNFMNRRFSAILL